MEPFVVNSSQRFRQQLARSCSGKGVRSGGGLSSSCIYYSRGRHSSCWGSHNLLVHYHHSFTFLFDKNSLKMQVLFTHKSVQDSGVIGENVLGIKISNDLSTSLTLSIQPFTVNCDIKIPASTPPAPSALSSPVLPSSLPAPGTEVKVEEPESAALPPVASAIATQTSLPTPIVTSTPPPVSLLDTYKVYQLDRIFTADRFYKYLLSAPSTSAYITTDDEFLSALHGITGADDCNADLVVEAYDGMNELRRGMMAEVIKVVEEGLERDGNERLDEWIKIEVPKILDEFM
ncbi:hypothetical protein B9Z19DRAFT_1074387 [Tuber borchii]|uniref:Uncharacterized protein n=1 Tax=Tuber borchii TaxID=42251 RepID=A0A2T7A4T2_TUBBO|nr:hypothetical protein B9Z19DRAFT_1074387 [Tuber borchii]